MGKSRFGQDIIVTGASTVSGDSSVGGNQAVTGNQTVSGTGAVGGSMSVGFTSAADSKALLEMQSTTKGFLPPRMTTTQRDAIASPPTGLTIYNTTTAKLNVYNATAWVETGSGGVGGINYIAANNGNSDFELGVTGYAAYADAAGVLPVDGTGGSPVLTITQTTSNPLRGLASGLITKDAANRQGNGIGYAFTIDRADQAKIMSISFDYEPVSGTYSGGSTTTDSDLEVYIYDVTNAVIIQPSGYKIGGAVNGLQYKQASCTFQTASNSTSYRLIFHVVTTSTSAWVMKIDNVSVGPQYTVQGPPVTDYQSYTPTWGAGFGTVTNSAGYYKRIGDSLEVIASCTVGTTAGTAATISLPSGLAIDVNKLTINNTSSNPGTLIGYYENSEALANSHGYLVTAPATSTSLIYFGNSTVTATSALTPAVGTGVTASSVVVSVVFRVPIAGWSSNTVMSNNFDGTIVSCEYGASGSVATSGFTAITTFYDTKNHDTTNSYNTTTGIYTVKFPGIYQITVMAKWGTIASGGETAVSLKINGSSFTTLIADGVSTLNFSAVAGSINLLFNAGDTIQFELYSGSAATASSGIKYNHFSINLLSGPSAIAASESVNARYFLTSNQTVSGDIQLTGFTKVFNSHNDLVSNAYVAPVPGTYELNIQLGSSSAGTNNQISAYQVNAGSITYIGATTAGLRTGGSDLFKLLAGDTVKIYASTAGSNTITAGATNTFFSISRIGN